MNNFEMIKSFNFDDMVKFVCSRTHCVDCSMKHTKECNEEINKCREKTAQWLLKESTYKPNYSAFDCMAFSFVFFFFVLGVANFINFVLGKM